MDRAKTSSIPHSRRWTSAEAQGVLEALERSGLPSTRFAARHGLGVERLYQWMRRLARSQAPSSQAPRFTEVRVAVPAPAAIELVLPDGIALRLAGASRLDDVIALLARLAAR